MTARRTSNGADPARLAETTATSLASTSVYPQSAPDAEHRPTARTRTWGGLAVAAAVPVAVPVALWIVSNPLAGAVILGTLALFVAAASLRRGRPVATAGPRETARSNRADADGRATDGQPDARSSAMPGRARRGSD